MIDYVALPQALADVAVTKGLPPGFEGHADVDHRPLMVKVEWKSEAAPHFRPDAWDRKLMKRRFSKSTRACRLLVGKLTLMCTYS